MPTIPAAPEQPHRRYSILRAMRLAADHRPLDGYEGEVNQELAKRNGRGAHGFWMPHSFSDPLGVEAAKRGLPPGMIEFRAPSMTAATGAGAIPLIVDPTNFIELLRNKAKVRQMGCKILTDLVGDLALPKQTGPGSAYWFNNENAAPNVSNQTTTQVAFYPKTIGAFTDISRAFIKQSCLDAEMFVREDLALVMALGLDLAAINGSGQGATPLGLLQNANVPTVPIATNGGNLTWDAVVTLESSITALNADIGEMQYLMNAPTRGDCKVIPKIGSTYPIFLMEPNGDMNGYKTQMSNQMPANLTKGIGTGLSAMLFGAWSQLIMAFWSGLDVLVDVYTGGTSGVIRIVMLQDADIQVRHPESFAKIVDIVTIT
jgi:HK97 family phage major capsid protein